MCVCVNAVTQVTYLTCCQVVPVHTTKASWTVEVQLHAFLTTALYAGELSVSCPGQFTAGGNPTTH
jgi:hypothetical protein